MKTAPLLSWVLPPDVSLEAIGEALPVPYRLLQNERKEIDRQIIDTVDGRIQHAELLLFYENDLLTLTDLDEQRCLFHARTAGTGFVDDLPAELQPLIAKTIDVRRLEPQHRIKGALYCFSIVDKRDKTVVRMTIFQGTVFDLATGQETLLPPCLSLIPLRGYAKPLSKCSQTFNAIYGKALPASFYRLAESVGHPNLSGMDNRVELNLEPKVSADSFLRQLLLRLLDILEQNTEGIIADRDSEYLHDFRVAVRRSRSAIGALKQILPEAAYSLYRAELKWLGDITTPLRDLDVYLLRFSATQSMLPTDQSADLVPFKTFLEKARQKEKRTLIRHLKGERFNSFIREWRRFLNSPAPEPPPIRADWPVGKLAHRTIRKTFSQWYRNAVLLNETTPAEPFHELRKTGKKLRYLMEFFRDLYPEAEIQKQISMMKTLQDHLGDFQDFQVQQEQLARFAQQMQQSVRPPAETLLAMGQLVSKLGERQRQAQQAFLSQFHQYASRKRIRKTIQLFGMKGQS